MSSAAINRVLEIMARLRAPEGGCPWDREQTLDSLKPMLIEECYELLDALADGDIQKHKEELGDLLLQIVFQCQLRREQGAFTFDDVCATLADKLVRRHPHVFGETKVNGTRDVLANWEAIKNAEQAGQRSVVDGVPRHLPALMKAQQVQARAARVGFDWTEVGDVVAKVAEELDEVQRALASGNRDRVRDELGDLLFAVVNLCRFQKLDAEDLLNEAVAKFARRFRRIEAQVRSRGQKLSDCTLTELDALWNATKDEEGGPSPG